MKRILLLLFVLLSTSTIAQVGVNTTNPDPSSMLDISATDKGVLVPRVSLANVTTTMLDGTNTAATGLLIWNTNAATVGGNGVGFYFFNGTQWMPITQSGTANTLDQAYDQGGTGVGRTITADAGAVTINGTDGLVTTGTFGSGAIAPSGAGTKMFFNPKKGAFRAGNINGTQWDDANIGNYSIAMGQNVTASGNGSVAFGNSNTSSGIGSTTFGTLNNATRDAAIAGGMYNTASGAVSTAFGYRTVASGDASTAFGIDNFARSYGETVVGIGATDYTAANTASSNPIGVTDRIFVVGNGVDANFSGQIDTAERSNALVILKSGETGLGATPVFGNRLTVGGKTATTNFQMTTGGNANYVLQSDSVGNATWVDPAIINNDYDIYEVGGTMAPNAITDNKYTQGTLTIGTNTAATGVFDIDNSTKATSVDINNTFATNPTGIDLNLTSNAAGKTGIKTQFNGTAATGTNTFIQNTDNMVGNTNRTAISNDFNGTSSSIATSITGLKNDFKSTSNYYAILYGINNSFASNTNAWNYGVSNSFTNSGSTPSFGVVNGFSGTSTGEAKGIFNGSNNYNGNVFGVANDFAGTGDGIHYAINNNLAGTGDGTHYGMYNSMTGTGIGTKYGIYNYIQNTAGGMHYGLYSNVLKAGSYAGYFLGNVSIGTTAANNYILPASRGTNGQTMQTDGLGNVSWVTPIVSTDHDIYEVGGTTAPNAITDNKYTEGTLTIGTNTAATGVLDIDNATKSTSLDISNTNTTDPTGIKIELNSLNSTKTGIDILLDGTNPSGGFSNFIHGEDKCINTQSSAGLYQVFDGSTSSTVYNKIGVFNDFLSTSNYQGIITGMYNSIYNNSNGYTYGINNSITGSGSGNKYGTYNIINSIAGGTHYGVYSEVLKAGSYAGYFLGNVGIGTSPINNYILPPSRGTNGQTMQTDGSGNVTWVNPVVDTDDQATDVFSLTGTTLNLSLQNDGVATQTVDLSSLDTDDQATDVFSLTGDTLNLSLQNDGVATQTVDLSPLKDHDWYEIGTTTAPNAITDNIFTQGNVAIGKNTIGPDTRVDIDNTNKITSLTLSNTYDIPASESQKYGIYNTLNSVEQQTAIKNDLLGNGSFKIGVDNLLQGTMLSGSGYGINTRFETTGGANQFGVYNTFASASSTGATISGMRNWFQAGSGYTSFLTGVANDFNNNNNGEHTAIANTFTGTGTGIKYGVKNTYTGTSGAQFYGSYTSATSGSGNIYGAYNNLSVTGNRYGVYNNLNSTGFGISYGTYNKINNTGGTVGAHFGVYNEMLAFDNQYGNYTTMPNGSAYSQYGNYVTIAGAGTGNRYGFYSTINSSAGGTHYGVYSDATKAGSYAGYFLGNVSIGTNIGNNYILPASRGTNGQIMQTDGSGNVSWTTPSIGGTLDDAYDFGGAGAGKIIVADSGPVAIIGTDGLVSTGTVGSGSVAPSGGGVRMVWNPRKAAFRAGSAYLNYWDDAQIGHGSFASGTITMASGNYSFASGNQSSATGTYATAMGFLSAATGNNATALSSGNATGDNSFAVGGGFASASYSTSLGLSQASGDYATAIGWSIANGLYSLSAGNSSTVGNYSTSLGFSNSTASFGETVLGIGSTFYTASVNGASQFRATNATDRLLVVGNAIDTNNNGNVDSAERSDALVMLKNGETGLGMNPVTGSRLAVSGKTQTTNFQMTSGAFGGYILQSDATGNATWVNPTTLSPVQWKVGGNSGTTAGTDYIGTNDAQDFDFRTNGILKLRLTQQGQLSFQNSGGSVFVGAGAGNSDDLTANQNTFVGTNSGTLTTTGNLNTAVGHFALDANTTGAGNTAIGRASLSVNDLGSNNTALGRLADVSTGSLSNASVIGFNATVNASNKVRLGNTAVTVVEGQVAYTNPSDARFKFNVKENVPGLDFVKKLKPVTYNFDTKKFENHLNPNRKEEVTDIDYSKSTAIIHTGFLAQDVEKICNDLGYDFDGLHIPDDNNPTDNYGVAYSQFIMPIVKAVQEQQIIIENQKTELEQLKSELEKYKNLEERIKALENK